MRCSSATTEQQEATPAAQRPEDGGLGATRRTGWHQGGLSLPGLLHTAARRRRKRRPAAAAAVSHRGNDTVARVGGDHCPNVAWPYQKGQAGASGTRLLHCHAPLAYAPWPLRGRAGARTAPHHVIGQRKEPKENPTASHCSSSTHHGDERHGHAHVAVVKEALVDDGQQRVEDGAVSLEDLVDERDLDIRNSNLQKQQVQPAGAAAATWQLSPAALARQSPAPPLPAPSAGCRPPCSPFPLFLAPAFPLPPGSSLTSAVGRYPATCLTYLSSSNARMDRGPNSSWGEIDSGGGGRAVVWVGRWAAARGGGAAVGA